MNSSRTAEYFTNPTRRGQWVPALVGLVALYGCGASSALEVPRGLGPRSDASIPEDGGDAGTDEPSACDPLSPTSIYLFSAERELHRFDPRSLNFETIGPIRCSSSASSGPYSMAVARDGTAYVLFWDGTIHAVDTHDASCDDTAFDPRPPGFGVPFGMGFVFEAATGRDRLYLAAHFPTGPIGLIDVPDFRLHIVGNLDRDVGKLELSGTSDGRLFGFGRHFATRSFDFVELDPSTAEILSVTPLPVGTPESSWAFAAWDDEFYLFTSGARGVTDVTRYRPAEDSLELVVRIPRTIVGAGVSTCAIR